MALLAAIVIAPPSSLLRPDECQVDLLAYHSVATPLALAGTEAAPTLIARARGGSAEYVLPPCARSSGAATFDVLGLFNVSGGAFESAPAACNITLNARRVRVAVSAGGSGGGAAWQPLGSILAPLLSPAQVALVFEDLAPTACILSGVRLVPRFIDELEPAHASSLRQRQRQHDERLKAAIAPTGPSIAPASPCWRAGPREIWRACRSTTGRCAFATLVLNDRFGSYAYALHQSLKQTGTTAPLVVMVTPDVSEDTIASLVRLGGEGSGVDDHGEVPASVLGGFESSALEGGASTVNGTGVRGGARPRVVTSSAGAVGCIIRIHRIGRLAYPDRYRATFEDDETRKSLRFTKLEAWRLTEYRKVVLIDTDTLVLKPIDALFTCPQGSAVGDMGAPGNFNSGVFVLEPSEAVYSELRRLTPLLISYNQGDQGFLNKAFPEWRLRPELQLPEVYNYFLKWRNSNSCALSPLRCRRALLRVQRLANSLRTVKRTTNGQRP